MVEDAALKAWFCGEVLPLEPALTRFIGRHVRSSSEVPDLRQDVYERVLVGASRELPTITGAYVFTVARNALRNRAKRDKIISIELVEQIDAAAPGEDWLTPARHAEGRQELRRLLTGLERLPPRCREVVRLRKVEGLSTKEVAARLGVGLDAVEQQTSLGMRALTDFMLGGSGRVNWRRGAAKARNEKLS